VDLGEEQRDPDPTIRDLVTMAVGDPFDETVQAEPAQVIGHASGRVGIDGDGERLGHPFAHGGVAETFGQPQKQAQDLQQGQYPAIIEAQASGPLVVADLRVGELIEHPFGQGTVLAEGLDLEQTAVGVEADGPQGGQIDEAASDAEVVGVVDRGLGAQGPAFLEVLLDLGEFVADLASEGMTP